LSIKLIKQLSPLLRRLVAAHEWEGLFSVPASVLFWLLKSTTVQFYWNVIHYVQNIN
jgi:hypothetical protein